MRCFSVCAHFNDIYCVIISTWRQFYQKLFQPCFTNRNLEFVFDIEILPCLRVGLHTFLGDAFICYRVCMLLLSVTLLYYNVTSVRILSLISVDRFRWPIERFQHTKYWFCVPSVSFQSTLRLCRTPSYFTAARFWKRPCRLSNSELLNVVYWRKF